MLRSTAIAALLAAALLTACGDDDDSDTPAADSTAPAAETAAAADTAEQAAASDQQAEPAARRRGTRIAVGDSQFGPVLFDGRQQAVYIFDRETTSRSRCYGECAVEWPPVLTRGRPVAGRGARRSLLGTTRRRDGKLQVTYNGHPLYYYDEPRGTVSCHNVDQFGGLWLAVKANGRRVP